MTASQPPGQHELWVRCADRGYTPGARDVAALLAVWDDASPQDRRAVGKRIVKALARGDVGVAAALLSGFSEVSGPHRALRLRVLAKLAQRFEIEGFARVCSAALTDPEPTVVREAARAVGKWTGLQAVRSEDALISVCDGAALPEQRAAVEALGRVGGAAALACLSDWSQPTDADLQRRIAEATTLIRRRAGRGRAGRVRRDHKLGTPQRVRLRCREGIASTVTEQLEAVRASGAAVDHGDLVPRRESVELPWSGDLAALHRVRCAIDVGLVFPVPRGPSATERIVAALTRPELVRALQAWTEGPVRFRLSFASHGTRRAVLWEVARRLAEEHSPLINDSRDVAWAIEVDLGTSTVVCRPKHADPRFDYRVADVPSASHPTIAALLAWVAAPRQGEVVWDPFCGSGSELVECATLASGLHLVGTDDDARAMQAARSNLDAAQLRGATVVLHSADARTTVPESGGRPVSIIISNPPMGRRVAGDGSMPSLLTAVVEHACTVLGPGGRMVWLSPTPQATAATASANGMEVQDRGTIDLGGFGATLQIFRRPAQG